MSGMGTPCVVCGMVPTRTVPMEWNIGMIVARNTIKMNKPLCRVHGKQMARSYLHKTLIFGWWGFISFFVNMFTVAHNIKAIGYFRDLPDPVQPGATTPTPRLVNTALLQNIPRVTPQGEWQPDPYVRHQYRWIIGTKWTDQVSDDGQLSVDPPGWTRTATA